MNFRVVPTKNQNLWHISIEYVKNLFHLGRIRSRRLSHKSTINASSFGLSLINASSFGEIIDDVCLCDSHSVKMRNVINHSVKIINVINHLAKLDEGSTMQRVVRCHWHTSI